MSEEKFIPEASVGTPQEKSSGATMERRGFFKWLSIGWIAFTAATGGFFKRLSAVEIYFVKETRDENCPPQAEFFKDLR